MFVALCVGLTIVARADKKQPPTSAAAGAWPAGHGKALVDPGRPKIDLGTDQPVQCQTDSRCNEGGTAGNICTDEGICLCDSSRGLTRCGEGVGQQSCIDVSKDNHHCGRCGNACPDGKVCNAGTCGAVKCKKGETMCGRYCADLKTEESDCGKCFHQCSGRLACINGHCER